MYAQIEKKCLAIAVEKFHTFVYGRVITVETMDIRKFCGTNNYSSLHVEELRRRDVTVSDTLTINAGIDILELSCQNYRKNFNEVNLTPFR